MTIDEYKEITQARIKEYKSDMRRLSILRSARSFMLINWRMHSEEYMQVLDDIQGLTEKWPRYRRER